MRLLWLSLLVAALPQDPALPEDPATWRQRQRRSPAEEWDALEGKPAPSLAGLTGWHHTPPLDWADLAGNVVVLVQLEPDRRVAEELQHLVALANEHREEHLVVLAVLSARSAPGARGFLRNNFLPLPLAVDEGDRLAQATSLRGYPTLHVVGRDGRVRIAGASRRRDEQGEPVLDSALKAILAEPFEGERKSVAVEMTLDEIIAEQERPLGGGRAREEEQENAPLRLDPDGWPVKVDKRLDAREDVRGRPLPELGVEHWLGPAPEVEGKCRLVYLFTTSDGPAMLFLAKLERIRAKFGDALAVIALSPQAPDATTPQGRPWANAVAEFFARFPQYAFHKALDGRRTLMRALGVRGLPHALLVSSDGIVRWQGYPLDPADPLTKKLVAAVLERDARRRAEEAERAGGKDDR